MKKRIALFISIAVILCCIIPVTFAEDNPGCTHDWVEIGTFCSEDVHDGTDKIVYYRCSLCGEEKCESVPTDVPTECLYTLTDVACANGTTATVAVCVYCGDTKTFYSGAQPEETLYTDEEGRVYSFSGDPEDVSDSVPLSVAAETVEETSPAEDPAEETVAEETEPAFTLAGGWQYLECANDIDEHALAVFELAKPLLTDGDYVPCALLGTQVVAGTNYCYLTFKTANTDDALSCYAVVYVYEDLSGAVSILTVTDIACDYGASLQEETTAAEEDSVAVEESAEPETTATEAGEAEETVITSEPELTDFAEEIPVVTTEGVAADGAETETATAEESTVEEAATVTEDAEATTESDTETAETEDNTLVVTDETTGEELFSACVSEDGLSVIVSLVDDSQTNYWRCSIADVSLLQLDSSVLTDASGVTAADSLTGIYSAIFKARVRSDGSYRAGDTVVTFSLVKSTIDASPIASFNLIFSVDVNGVMSVSVGDVPYSHIY